MAVTVFTSIGSSPGVSTTVLGLAQQWGSPVLLVEADITKPSTVVSGYLRGSRSAQHGLNDLANITNIGINASDVLSVAFPIDEEEELLVLAGLPNPVAAAGMNRLWAGISASFQELESAGFDILIDYGRYSFTDPYRTVLLEQSDQVVVLTGTGLPDVTALKYGLDPLAQARSAIGKSEHLSLGTIGRGANTLSHGEIIKYMQLPSAGHIPFDPAAAATLSYGEPIRERLLKRNHFAKSIHEMAASTKRAAEQSAALYKTVVEQEQA